MEENEKRDINMVAMEVIMNAGDGRDKIDEALADVYKRQQCVPC